MENRKHNIDIMNDYISDTSLVVSRALDLDMNTTKSIVKNIVIDRIKNGESINPIVTYYGKDSNGDRIIRKKPLTKYFDGAKNGLIAPSGTVYLDHSVELSIHAKNTGVRSAKRSIVKKEGFLAEQQGNNVLAAFKDKMQKAYKKDNNTLSGLLDNPYNPSNCPSGHYTLTSTTATVTSIGNALGESMVGGNRIYTSPDVVIAHIISVARNSDIKNISRVVERYRLHYPTIDECMAMILMSTRFYWSSDESDDNIRTILATLTPIELCAVMYVNDMYHLRVYNPRVVRAMIRDMLVIKKGLVSDPAATMKSIPEDIMILGKSILYDVMAAHAKREEVVDFKDDLFPETKDLLASTCYNLVQVMDEFDDISQAFFLTNNLPVNVADIKSVIRKCTVLSDTDSTCATYQEWILWYFRISTPKFTAEEVGVTGIVLLFFIRALAKSLEMFSRRMNIKGNYVKLLAMKNEFYWRTMVFMNKTKHYYADAAIQEGNVYAKTKLELKGSNLINSTLPASIKKLSDDYFKRINALVTSGAILNLHEIVADIANIEREITRKMIELDSEILKEETILDHTSYKLDKMKSAYYHAVLWNEVFGPKYGMATVMPMVCIKVKTNMTTKKSMLDLIGEIADDAVRERFLAFIAKYPRDGLGVLRLPKDMVLGIGIPVEIQHMLSIRPAVEELCSTFYLILESIGYFKRPGMLLSDMY